MAARAKGGKEEAEMMAKWLHLEEVLAGNRQTTELQLTDVELQTNKSTFVQIFFMFCNDVREVKSLVMTKEHFICTS